MIRIAAAETPVTGDIAANGETIRRQIASAAAEGVRLACFCEGALSGYAKLHIRSPGDWPAYDWGGQERELRAIADTCARHRIFAAVGGAHRLVTDGAPPHNCIYVIDDRGRLLTRYDKRYLSNAELGGWYTPGTDAVIFEVDGWRFGLATCIEIAFAEVFMEYERLGVDGVLFATSGFPPFFRTASAAHAGMNEIWLAVAAMAGSDGECANGIAAPDGEWIEAVRPAPGLAIADLDRAAPHLDVALNKARPWRAKAREGEIYRSQRVVDPRSRRRDAF